MSKQVLVIKLGALGDFVLAFGPFAAIRAHHPADRITLLTTAPFADLARRSPWFDWVEVDPRPAWWDLRGIAALRQQLRGYDLVYDLQTSGRSSQYFRLAGRPAWSGIARGASLPHSNPDRDRMHTVERQREQLSAAGITDCPLPDVSWLAREGPDLAAPLRAAGPGGSAAPPGQALAGRTLRRARRLPARGWRPAGGRRRCSRWAAGARHTGALPVGAGPDRADWGWPN